MWDNWESGYGCSRKCIAVLRGYRRTFNKASTHNRGIKNAPSPTLNLETEAAGHAREWRSSSRISGAGMC